ncbi:hypothetical protein Aple_023330 [Acrocarpospora pleiomorpha]|uniref:Uncharacterized protein n=1 Tax=Acrocarpospora pleiomorpha TaxID=90975 RepID=A0A5M3XCQ3_9ACTN|nr:hypothetical protein Aple_023330 [Acrocarpospora pleiomorpha]
MEDPAGGPVAAGLPSLHPVSNPPRSITPNQTLAIMVMSQVSKIAACPARRRPGCFGNASGTASLSTMPSSSTLG